jgi:DNA-binding IclR family transcriptional regulator
MSERGEAMIDRVIRVLEVFDAGSQSLTASEIARRASIPMPTAHRIVGHLLESGLLERDADRRIRTGIRLWELVTRSSSTLSLREVALPFMDDLQKVVQQHAQLSILDRNDVLCVEMLKSRHSTITGINVIQPGDRLPVLACAPGLALTAFSGPQLRDELVTTARVTKFTNDTIVDRGALRKMLSETRHAGFVVLRGWIHPGTASIAVPIIGKSGVAAAALSVIVPRDAAGVPETLAALRTTGHGISRTVQSGLQSSDMRLNLLRSRIRRATEVQ